MNFFIQKGELTGDEGLKENLWYTPTLHFIMHQQMIFWELTLNVELNSK